MKIKREIFEGNVTRNGAKHVHHPVGILVQPLLASNKTVQYIQKLD